MANKYATGSHASLQINGNAELFFESWSIEITVEQDTVGNDQDFYDDTNPTSANGTLSGTYRGEQPEIYGIFFNEGYRPVPKEQLSFTGITPEGTYTGAHLVPSTLTLDSSNDETLTNDFEVRVDRPDFETGGNGEREIQIGTAAVQS